MRSTVKVPIVALMRQQAEFIARWLMLPPKNWQYVNSDRGLYGITGVVFVHPSSVHLAEWHQIRDRLDYVPHLLGLYVNPDQMR